VPNDGYDFVSGSSMAAANVSGSISLLLSHRLKAEEVRDALAQTMNRGNSINVCLALVGPRASQCEPGTPAATQRAASDVRTGSQ
jgi:subtilisin family serine protease